MKWSVAELQKHSRCGFKFTESGDFSNIKKRNKQIDSVSTINIRGRMTIDTDLIAISMTISGNLTLYCVRTLVPALFPVAIQTLETFSLWPNHTIDADYVISNTLDLEPVVEEILLAHIPIQVYATDDDIKGTSIPSAGNGWSLISEKKGNDDVDPRLAKLFQCVTTED